MIKTTILTGVEQEVTFAGTHTIYWVQNLGSGDILVGLEPELADGKDDVLIVPSGGTGYVRRDAGTKTVYLSGTGKAQVYGTNNAFCPFKAVPKGGGELTTEGGAITGTVDYPIVSLNMYGNSTQDGTPTPEAPIDIVSVGDDENVKITSRSNNLFDFNAWKSNISHAANVTYSLLDNGVSIKVSDQFYGDIGKINTNYYMNVTPGKKYTFSMNTVTNQGYAVIYGNNGSEVTRLYATGSRNHLTFDVPSDVTQVRILLWFDNVSESNTFTNLQLEEGSVATAYVPYGNTATITSGLPLCSIGDVRDELVYNVDGTGKIIKRTAKLDSYNGEAITTDYISSTGGLDTGAEVVYELENPQETELSAAEITALMKLQTFNGVTHIYNDEGAEMKVKIVTNPMFSELIKPVLDGFDKRITSLEAALTAFMEG